VIEAPAGRFAPEKWLVRGEDPPEIIAGLRIKDLALATRLYYPLE